MKAFRAAAKQIKKETGDRVKLRFYPGGVMGNDKSVLRKIKVGQLHGGALGAGGMSNITPDSQILSMPFAFDNYQEVDAVRKEMDSLILAKLKEAGYIGYGLIEGGFAYMMSDRKLTTLDEVQGRKVWSPEGDAVSRVALEALGIAPVPLPMTDVLTGLQTGLINAVSAPPTATIALQWHTQVKHLTDIPLLYTYGTVILSQKALNKISPEDQAIIQRELGKAMSDLNTSSRIDNESAMKALIKHGITVSTTSGKELKNWRAKVDSAIDNMSGSGRLSPEIIKQLRQLIAKQRGS
jgi:TRAP-type C4-dicarboxylate transport system substrate-binding protein